MTAPKRRWFRFSLATMFVVLTVSGCLLGWVAYSLNWIHDRHAVFDRLQVRAVPPSDGSKKAPSGLWVFGEAGIEELWCWSVAPEDVELVRRLYPESEIVELNGGGEKLPGWFLQMGSPR